MTRNDKATRERIEREQEHAAVLLETKAISRPWTSAAGLIRKERRVQFLTTGYDGLPKNPRVLEVGCGTGIFTEHIARAFADVTAIDVAEPLLEEARARVPTARVENCDVHTMSYPAESFDIVVGCSILHHLDWDAALRRIFAVLKPGGQIRFCEPNLMNPQIFIQKNWPWLKRVMGDSPDEYAFTAGQIMESLTAAGFVDASATPFEFLHPATPSALIGAVVGVEKLIERTPLGGIGGTLKISALKPATAVR